MGMKLRVNSFVRMRLLHDPSREESPVTVNVPALAATLHTLFTTTAARLGRTSGLLHRRRRRTADDFARTLVFGWIDHPQASLESFAVRLDLSAQAPRQRMNPKARDFFTALI